MLVSHMKPALFWLSLTCSCLFDVVMSCFNIFKSFYCLNAKKCYKFIILSYIRAICMLKGLKWRCIALLYALKFVCDTLGNFHAFLCTNFKVPEIFIFKHMENMTSHQSYFRPLQAINTLH